MSRLIDHRDMTAAQIVDCCIQATAIMYLCETAAWSIQNGGEANAYTFAETAGSIKGALAAARELLAPVLDALESHEGLQH
ncbi:hypothetical protein DBIPINDM_008200 (plasmid) [Mesorhizobium sp. AR02]|uniref:hypothetical protein n=1 Tax=Mesorhizobium sp. AR02 TaxID=2865837 RepID=UPI00215FA56F|nr:hypothetical protein [Mesorhizobium sp. AR02]UVK57589.1 hypothetical protein DBIPINDM_008200 [Mesorhizobium sp. AR02]